MNWTEKRISSGFSLLELIIVLVIIGVLVAAITMSITDTRNDKLRFEARRLTARISLAIDEAIISNQQFGLEINNNSYRFLVLTDRRWQAIGSGDEKQLIEQELPEGIELQLEVEGLYAQFQQQGGFNELFNDSEDNTDQEKDAADLLRPQIFLLSSGELNPFKLVIGYEGENPLFYKLEATYDGKLSLEGPVRGSMSYQLGKSE